MSEPIPPDSQFLKRVTSLISSAGLPAVVLGFVGDFFSPVGGWIWALGIGVIALILTVYLLATLSASDASERTWWMRLSKRDKEIWWIWQDRPAYKCHGVHLCFVFSAVCLVLAYQSFGARSEGGVLAKNVEMLKVAQQSLGIQQAILDEAKQTNKHLGSMDKQLQEHLPTLAKEVSDDPAKEINKLTGRWSQAGFNEAISDRNLRVISLYLQSGMAPSDAGVQRIFQESSPEIRQVLLQHGTALPPQQCARILPLLRKTVVLDPPQLAPDLIRKLCSNSEARKVAQEKIAEARKLRAEHDRENAQRPTVSQCVAQHSKRNYDPLMEKASRFHPTQPMHGDDAKLVTEVYLAMMTGDVSPSTMARLVKTYCEEAAKPQPFVEGWGPSVEQWTAIARWIE